MHTLAHVGVAIALGSSLVAAGTTAAHALDLYVTVKSGAMVVPEADFSTGNSAGLGVPLSGGVDIGPAYVVGGEIGAMHSSGLRGGIEVFFSGFSPDELSASAQGIGPIGTFPLQGNGTSLGVFGNLGYEYLGFGEFRPFVEGGVGFIRVGLDDIRAPGINGFADDSDMVLAGKVGAGFAVEVLQPWHFTMSYHYLLAQDADLEFTVPGVQNTPFSLDFNGHMFGAGLRYMF